jgi:hypothetical protein
MRAPKAFISYSHDSQDHKDWTKKLASDLRARGVDVTLDQWDLLPGQDLSLFMQRGIAESDRVVMVCSSAYVKRAETGSGGVGYERLIVTEELVRSIDTIKFIPVVRGNDAGRKLPIFMGPRLYIDFENDAEHSNRVEELARAIHGAPAVSKPPLGPNPYGASDATTVATQSLDDLWFAQKDGKATQGINGMHMVSCMTLRANVAKTLSKSQSELLDAVTQSEIRTFGWPIGITLQTEKYQPRPYADGIRAEVAVEREDRKSYDYWALRSNGDFFLLQSLFEDMRDPKKIFFDTRIVRVTESLMFFESLYTKLGAAQDAQVGVRVNHRGFRGRELSAASSSRQILPFQTAFENDVQSEISTVLGKMKESRVEDVRKLLSPMFRLFNLIEFHKKVYEDIVRKFEQGIVT